MEAFMETLGCSEIFYNVNRSSTTLKHFNIPAGRHLTSGPVLGWKKT